MPSIDQAQAAESTTITDVANETRSGRRKRSLLSRVFRWVLWIVLALVLILVIVAGVLYWLAGTDSGFAKLSSLANDKVAGLSIQGSSGNLRHGVNAQSVQFSNDSLDIRASAVQSQWQLGCLLQRRFCLDNLTVQTLDIDTFATDEAAPAAVREGPIELPDILLPIDVDFEQIRIERLRFQAPGDAPPQVIDNLTLSASTDNSVVTIDNASLQYQDIDIALAGRIELRAKYPLDMTLNVAMADVLPDTVPEGNGAQPLQITTRLAGTLATLKINSELSGLASVQLDATVKPLQPTLPATLSISSEALGWPVQSRSQVLASGLRIDASGDMNDYEFSIDADVQGEQIPATSIAINGLANTERLMLPEIIIDTLGGNAQASAQLALKAPQVWSTRWDIQDIDPSLHVPDLQGSLGARVQASGSLDQDQWSLKLDEAVVDGTLRDLPFRLDTKLSKGLNNVWFIERIDLNNDKNQLRVQGFIDDELDIKADINLPQLQNFLPGLAGGFDARVVAKGTLSSPDVSLIADADVIRFNDLLVRSLNINGDIDQLFVDTSTLDISVDTLRIGENTVTDTAVSLTGTRRNHQLALQANGPKQTRIALALLGALDESLNWSGVLDKVTSDVPGHTLTLTDPVSIEWQNSAQRVSISKHCWLVSDDANLCLRDDINTDSAGNARLTLEQYSLQQLHEFLPDNTAVSGVLAANVDLRWGENGVNDRQAVVSATIDRASVQTEDALGEPVSFSYQSIALDADLTPVDATATLNLESSTLGTANIRMQLDPSNPDSALDGEVQLQGLTLAIAEAFLPDFDTVGGTISASGTLAGTLTAPAYNGTVVLDSPILEAEILPLPITGGQITARIAGQNLTLDGKVLSDAGSIELTGRGQLDPKKWNAELNLKGRELSIQSDPVQQATVNHDIQIVATPRRLSVIGDINIPQATINVAELPEGAATVSSDIVIIEDEQSEVQATLAESTMDLTVALDVALGDEVSLSAYGLDANLTGDIDVRIRGTRPPQLGGEIRVVDGVFKKYGQDLQANGQILFVGPVDSTQLAIDAVREIDDEERTAGLRIQGTVASPEITLFTEPSDKTQDAILSYIILGRDINQASDQEADLLATAALALAIKGGNSVGGGVANKLGVEEFGLETRGSGNSTELVVSGRLNDRLLLRYGYGVFDAENTLYLRYDLTKRLYLEAARGTQRAVDLFYSFSF